MIWVDRAHRQTESLLTALESRLRRLYRKRSKSLLNELEPLVSAIVIDGEHTQKQRLDYAERHGLPEIAGIFSDALVETNERAIKDINRTMLSVYGVNFQHMAAFFEREVNIDIAGGD